MAPLVLPDKLELRGTTQENLAILYAVFRSDLIAHRAHFQGLPVVLDNRFRDGFEVGFWHIITRDDREGARELD